MEGGEGPLGRLAWMQALRWLSVACLPLSGDMRRRSQGKRNDGCSRRAVEAERRERTEASLAALLQARRARFTRLRIVPSLPHAMNWQGRGAACLPHQQNTRRPVRACPR